MEQNHIHMVTLFQGQVFDEQRYTMQSPLRAPNQQQFPKKSELEDNFNQEIEELSQETENLVTEIEKWQM